MQRYANAGQLSIHISDSFKLSFYSNETAKCISRLSVSLLNNIFGPQNGESFGASNNKPQTFNVASINGKEIKCSQMLFIEKIPLFMMKNIRKITLLFTVENSLLFNKK